MLFLYHYLFIHSYVEDSLYFVLRTQIFYYSISHLNSIFLAYPFLEGVAYLKFFCCLKSFKALKKSDFSHITSTSKFKFKNWIRFNSNNLQREGKQKGKEKTLGKSWSPKCSSCICQHETAELDWYLKAKACVPSLSIHAVFAQGVPS